MGGNRARDDFNDAPFPVAWLLTSLSPCTVICFFKDALSLKILAHESKWHLNVFTAAAPPTLLPVCDRIRFPRVVVAAETVVVLIFVVVDVSVAAPAPPTVLAAAEATAAAAAICCLAALRREPSTS